MSDADPKPAPAAPVSSRAAAPTRFSLERLSSAFARLMGGASRAADGRPQVALEPDDAETPADDALPVTPQMIVEGMLFVGCADGRPLTSREMAAHIRDVQPSEVDSLVDQLNESYRQDGAAYEIVAGAGGYRLQLRADLGRLRERFRGRVRATKLTPSAIEVLSVVAYRQGVTSEQVNRLRGSRSQAILAQLVRRNLLRVERPATAPRSAHYHTTERFNQFFGIGSPAELPQSKDLADS